AAAREHRACRHPLNQMILLQPVRDEIADRPDLEPMGAGEIGQIGEPGHGPVLAHDLADHAAGVEAGEAATSTAASVWPARTSTPPGLATSGKTWPGDTMASASLAESIAT